MAQASSDRVVIVSGAATERSAARLEDELDLLGYSVERDTDISASLMRLRQRDVDAVIVLPAEGEARYYVLRSGTVLVETELEDREHPEDLALKTAEGVRGSLQAEAGRDPAPAGEPAPWDFGIGPVFEGASYAGPRLGLEGLAQFRLTDTLYLGPRIKGTLLSDYGEAKSELGAANLVAALTGCLRIPTAPLVTWGLCSSLGARAIFLTGISGPQKGESGGQIWGPLLGAMFFGNYDVSPHFALRGALGVDFGLGAYGGPEMLPKRSTDLLAAQRESGYAGVDIGLSLSVVYRGR